MPSAHINGDWFSAAKTLIFYEITRQELWYTPGQIFLCHFRGTAGLSSNIFEAQTLTIICSLNTCRCSRLGWAIKLHDQTRVRMLETMNVPRSRAAGCRVCGTLLGSRCKYFNGGFSNIRSPSRHCTGVFIGHDFKKKRIKSFEISTLATGLNADEPKRRLKRSNNVFIYDPKLHLCLVVNEE